MTTFTSSLPKNLLTRLDQASKKLNLPKNRLIEKALSIYLDQLNRAEYVASYKLAGHDNAIMSIAEEGMTDYMTQLSEENEAR
ncbi:MAG: ribbon-helix-helix domain-containing protein [Bacteroidetes bacterium]|nr:ribbon-helix-helix domain-containing protein [Bacteroidota bacterium]MDA1119541.1 ribbon-helix-helix domain-containing protein [Bacteroidota bacterium]